MERQEYITYNNLQSNIDPVFDVRFNQVPTQPQRKENNYTYLIIGIAAAIFIYMIYNKRNTTTSISPIQLETQTFKEPKTKPYTKPYIKPKLKQNYINSDHAFDDIGDQQQITQDQGQFDDYMYEDYYDDDEIDYDNGVKFSPPLRPTIV